jgi:translation initiation factor 2 gamma subunit (eIF-2gamma)
MVLEGESGQEIPITPQITVPGKEAVYLQIQGLRLLKTNLGNDEPGGLLQIRCQTDDSVTVIGSAVELEASAHAPDTEDL